MAECSAPNHDQCCDSHSTVCFEALKNPLYCCSVEVQCTASTPPLYVLSPGCWYVTFRLLIFVCGRRQSMIYSQQCMSGCNFASSQFLPKFKTVQLEIHVFSKPFQKQVSVGGEPPGSEQHERSVPPQQPVRKMTCYHLYSMENMSHQVQSIKQ